MSAWMDDAVHIKIEIVELEAIGVGLGEVWVNQHSIHLLREYFNRVHDGFAIFLCKPPKITGNSHGEEAEFG